MKVYITWNFGVFNRCQEQNFSFNILSNDQQHFIVFIKHHRYKVEVISDTKYMLPLCNMPSKIQLCDLWVKGATLTFSQTQWLMHVTHCLNVENICDKLYESPFPPGVTQWTGICDRWTYRQMVRHPGQKQYIHLYGGDVIIMNYEMWVLESSQDRLLNSFKENVSALINCNLCFR